MKLIDLFQKEPKRRKYWSGQYKIPWDEPGFSARMLREHLTQDHNRASRRFETINQHVDWIHNTVLGGEPSRILDLGCGPGFYTRKLAALGHSCVGIDFGPASIDYAKRYSSEKDACEYLLADLRAADYGEDFDLAMMIFGEFNAFPKKEAEAILARMHAALKPGGQLLIEGHTFDTVKRVGMTPGSWYQASAGLFSDKPHICLVSNEWSEKSSLSFSEYTVIDAHTAEVERFHNTLKAYTNDQYAAMLTAAGFTDAQVVPAWEQEEFTVNDLFVLLLGKK